MPWNSTLVDQLALEMRKRKSSFSGIFAALGRWMVGFLPSSRSIVPRYQRSLIEKVIFDFLARESSWKAGFAPKVPRTLETLSLFL